MIRSMTCALLLGISTSCGSASVPEIGSYTLDVDQFAGALADALIKSGRAPASSRPVVTAHLKSSVFDLTLQENGTFSVRQKLMQESHTYRGTWSLEGEDFRLDQTHADGHAKADTMRGQLVNGKLTLTHREAGGEVTFDLYHVEAMAAPSR